jgi:hypothetical protein
VRTELQIVRGDVAPAASIASRGVARNAGRASEFSGSLAVAANELAGSGRAPSQPSGGVSQRQPTPSVSSDDPVRPEREQSRGRNGLADFPSGRSVVDVPAASEMEAYFLTHAPAEWSSSPEARAKFAEIYGEPALVTLDWLGTVPNNMDSTWVTSKALDASGRPYPKVREQKELT